MLRYSMSKVFKKTYPYDTFVKYLSDICIQEKDGYLFDISLYKKAVFLEKIQPFIDDLDEYYKESKKHYIHKKMNYKSFITILRQLCKRLEIRYDNSMKYLHNSYQTLCCFSKYRK